MLVACRTRRRVDEKRFLPTRSLLGCATANQEFAASLKYYQSKGPRAALSLYEAIFNGQTPRCLSVSLWWFRILMLAWALWLAASLIRWLRWAWTQFSTGGCFHQTPKNPATPPPLQQT